MKAKEYAQKYIESLETNGFDDGLTEASSELLFGLLEEAQDLIKHRQAQTNSAFFSIIKEQNQKFRAINRHLEKHYGFPIFHADGFKTVVREVVPEIFVQLPKTTWL